jgi:hypothetical protein
MKISHFMWYLRKDPLAYMMLKTNYRKAQIEGFVVNRLHSKKS